MTKVPGHDIWIMLGYELASLEPVKAAGWYVCHTQRGNVGSGPYPSEASAMYAARAMTDTSGT